MDAASPGGELLGIDEDIDVMSAVEACRATLAENTGPVNGVAFSPDGDTLAGGGELQMIALWSVARQEAYATAEVATRRYLESEGRD